MKKLLTYIKDFVRQDYTFSTYLSIFLFLTISIFINYYVGLEKEIIAPQPNLGIQFLLYLLLYCLAYYGTLLIIYLTRRKNLFLHKTILAKSFLALLLICFDRSFNVSTELLQKISELPTAESHYLSKIINQFIPSVFYILLIFLIYKKYDTHSNSFYGLSLRRFDIMLYGYMLLCMIPLLTAASFLNEFTSQYPFFKYWNFANAFDMTGKQMFSIYEFFYLFNFINIELLFRGLLVIGMIQYMGKEAILPMVVTYAFIHFGKPFPETISSVFGGYVLGVFAFKTENILGGIFIHMAIALLMDLFALLQLYYSFS